MLTKPKNAYIFDHQLRMKSEKQYDDYLKWCDKNNQAPEDEKVNSSADAVVRELRIERLD